MTLFLAVILFALARPLLAGYAGACFFPTVLREAASTSAPFLILALIMAILERPALQRVPPVLRSVLPWAGLFGLLGRGWVEPHTVLVDAIGSGRTLGLLLACGVAVGLLVGWIDARASRRYAQPLLIAAAGWFILGPDLYQRWDDVDLWHRSVAALAVASAFALAAVALLVATRRARARSVDASLLLAVVLLAAFAAFSPGSSQERPRSPIVLVVVDTLRAEAPDRTKADGAPLMPRFQEIARSGVRYTQAVAPSPWTLPSIVSVLSAMNPYRHQTGRLRGYVALPGRPAGSWLGPALRDAGYQSAGFVNNPWLRPYYGLGKGYLSWQRYRGDARDGVNAALGWLDVHGTRPYFLFLHLMDPHWPYEAPAGFGEPRRPCSPCDDLGVLQYTMTGADVHEEVRRRYDAETAFADHELGRLWDELGRRGALDDAWLIVTSDHGEEFWDHLRFLHGHTLYDELLRVPLVIVPPLGRKDARRGIVVDEQVRLEDVGATVADLARVEVPNAIDGRTLLAEPDVWGALARLSTSDPLRPGDPARERPVLAGFLQEDGRRDWAVRAGGVKYIRTAEAWMPLVFDVASDPRETVAVKRPLASLALAAIPDQLGFSVERRVLRVPPAEAAIAAGGLRRELRSLGYAH